MEEKREMAAVEEFDTRDERIKQLEEENTKLKAMLFDYMMKEKTA